MYEHCCESRVRLPTVMLWVSQYSAIHVICPGGRKGGGGGKEKMKTTTEKKKGHSAALTSATKLLFYSVSASPVHVWGWMNSPHLFPLMQCYSWLLMASIHIFTQSEQEGITIPSTLRDIEGYYWVVADNSLHWNPKQGPLCIPHSALITMNYDCNPGNLSASHDLWAATINKASDVIGFLQSKGRF